MSPRLAFVAAGLAGLLLLTACSPEEAAQYHINEVFGPAADQATRVARCESNMDAGATSPGGGNHGLFQINDVHRASFSQVTGQAWSAVYDPYWNAVFAKSLYDRSGWGPWACGHAA